MQHKLRYVAHMLMACLIHPLKLDVPACLVHRILQTSDQDMATCKDLVGFQKL